MTKPAHTIPCPVCQTGIPVDVHLLLKGSQFTCPNCKSSIKLDDNSRDQVKKALEKFDEVKNNIMEMKSKAKKP